jgi:hypothetical protein
MATFINQNLRTLPTLVQEARFAFRFAGDRSSDTQRTGQPGQDFIAYSATPDRLCFALCDGVSQSFLGDVGARLIGEALIIWLEKECQAPLPALDLQTSLLIFLKSITASATAQVKAQTLPPDLPMLMLEVLEEKRSLGSQSMFIGVRVDLPGAEYPHGRIIFAWMGDSRLRAWGTNGENTDVFGDSFKTDERWSSNTGPVNGVPHVYSDKLIGERGNPKWKHILAYSDGLTILDSISEPLTNSQIVDIFDQLAELPASDDVSLFEFWLGKAPSGLDNPVEKIDIRKKTESDVIPPATLPPPDLVENYSVPPGIPTADGKASGSTRPVKREKSPDLVLIILIPILIIVIGLVVWLGNNALGILWPNPTNTPTVLPTAGPLFIATTKPTLTLTAFPSPTPSTTATVTSTITQSMTPTITPSITIMPPATVFPASPLPTINVTITVLLVLERR